jgi:tRNA(Ile)-lysidine synthase
VLLIEAAVFAALDRLHPGGTLGLAVSGGGDSMALMHLARLWAADRGAVLRVATVDHGLRAESAAEAQGVIAAAEALGCEANLLRWAGWQGRGNLQAAAREARQTLLADWAERYGVAAIALAHTHDDQAETVLMRLLRGSGVDGLAAMSECSEAAGLHWLRPLLRVVRADLRDWLRRRGIGWVEDPSNDDTRFDRVRVRQAMAALGLGADGLAETAARMQDARTVLEDAEADLARRAAMLDRCGCIWLCRPTLAAARSETRMRLLARCFRLGSGAAYAPRRAALQAAWEALMAGDGLRTLHGCLAEAQGDTLRIMREPAALRNAMTGRLWDGRWAVLARGEGQIAALGEAGLRALREAAEAGLWHPPAAWRACPRTARQTTPALWHDESLACAPLAAYGEGLEVSWVAPLPGAASH